MQTNHSPIVLLKTVTRITLERLRLLPYIRKIQKKIDLHLYTLRQNRLAPGQIEAIYVAQYHEKSHYGKFEDGEDSGWEPDAVIKLEHAKAIKHILPQIKKALIGGCSSGMGVFAFRQLGVQAWGF